MRNLLGLRLLTRLVAAMLFAQILAGSRASLGAETDVRTSVTAGRIFAGADSQDCQEGQPLGSGDGRIQVIPALSVPSVKNGGKLTIQAVVKAGAGVAKVEAEIEGVARLELKPTVKGALAPAQDGLLSARGIVQAAAVLYQAEWVAVGLEEKVYPVTLSVTDMTGHRYLDRTLSFSDPAAGNSTPGSTTYPCGTAPRRVGAIVTNGYYIESALLDLDHGYAYFGANFSMSSAGQVIKVRLSDFVCVGSLTLNYTEKSFMNAVIDPSGDAAYFCTYTIPGKIVKIRLSDFTRVGAITLNADENNIGCAVIDPAGGYAYFGTNSSQGKVIKLRLSDFTRVDTLTLDTTERYLQCAVIDPPNGYAYFGAYGAPVTEGRIVKVRLSDFTRVDALIMNPQEYGLIASVIDRAQGYAYFVTNFYPGGNIIKIRLADFTRVGTLNVSNTDRLQTSAAIDPDNGYGYFGISTLSTTGTLLKVRLSDFSIMGRLSLNSKENGNGEVLIDPVQEQAYVATMTDNGIVVKLALSCKNAIHASKITIPEKAILTDLRFYSHTAVGNLRMAIYDDAPSKNMLWQSGAIANTATEAWLTVPVGAGAPSVLTLQPGTYWLAWQTDSTANIASHTVGPTGTGFLMEQPFDSFPATIGVANISTNENLWSLYLTYTAPRTLTVTSPYGTPAPPVGTRTYDGGTAVTASVASPVGGGTGIQYVCTGWTGTGSVPASGTGNNANFTLTQDSSLTWLWKTQYKLTATADPASRGSVKLGDGVTAANGTWHDAGTKLTLKAVPNAGSKFAFWWGALGGRTNPGSLTLGAPATVGARFDASSNGVAGWENYGE